MLDPELMDLMTDTVTVTPWTSDDAYGAPQYAATGTTYPARVEYRAQLVVNRQGREVVSNTTVYFGHNSAGAFPGLTTRDRLTLPDATSPEILSIKRLTDETGLTHHEAAYC